jgi:tRNA1(Val) A37 N6-methylase TrmN6
MFLIENTKYYLDHYKKIIEKNLQTKLRKVPDPILAINVFRLVKNLENKKVLDYGSGDGVNSVFLKKYYNFSLSLFDINPLSYVCAKKNFKLHDIPYNKFKFLKNFYATYKKYKNKKKVENEKRIEREREYRLA